MTTRAAPSLPLTALFVALRRSWPAALAEAVLYGVAALFDSAAGADEMGISI